MRGGTSAHAVVLTGLLLVIVGTTVVTEIANRGRT